MPVFALSNTGVVLHTNLPVVIAEPSSLGIIFGLIIGKPLGIFVFSWLAHKMRIGELLHYAEGHKPTRSSIFNESGRQMIVTELMLIRLY